MQQPPYLKPGDQITIISTARKITLEELKPALSLFEQWGLKVNFGQSLFKIDRQFAGTKEQRIADLQAALDDQQCKAIVCARGGYGTVQLVDSLDFSTFRKHPKWLVGYSDVTVLHNHINQNFGIETLHANMPISFPMTDENETTETIKKALFGEKLEFNFEMEKESTGTETNISAPIVGGNLSILYSLTGTSSQLNTEGKFLFMEDLDEYLYHIDRMMMNLKRAGLFKGCKGILVGGMSDMNDNKVPFGLNAKEIILENTKELNIPVIFGVPSGHIDRNLALIMNRNVTLKISEREVNLEFDGRA
jgi:muramoyltetrapeptide carboxypeptidase